jgi:uncharacterized Zn finger protein (UPF0148 family)
MAHKILKFNCDNCGSEGIISYEPEFGEPIFCPFCSEELIEEEELNNKSFEEDDEDDEEEDYDLDSPLDDMIMDIELN